MSIAGQLVRGSEPVSAAAIPMVPERIIKINSRGETRNDVISFCLVTHIQLDCVRYEGGKAGGSLLWRVREQ